MPQRRLRRTSYTPSSCTPPSSPAAVGHAAPATTEAELPITQGGGSCPSYRRSRAAEPSLPSAPAKCHGDGIPGGGDADLSIC